MVESVEIEIQSEGRSTIPIISPENIITIHGKNGVGKSMASTLMEIATGDYIFKNEEQFDKLSKIIKRCDIVFKISKKVTYKVNLQPFLWKFDSNLNRIKPITLGKFFQNNDEIEFSQFRQNLYIRTIRGDESLHQQILFFKDIFISKIQQKLIKLEKKKDFLDKFNEWFTKSANEIEIEQYQKFQVQYNDLLNKSDNLRTSNQMRDTNLKFYHDQIELLKKLHYILTNDSKNLEQDKMEISEKMQAIQKEISENHKIVAEIDTKSTDLEAKFDIDERKILQKLHKLNNRRNSLKKEFLASSEIAFDKLDEFKTDVEQKNTQLQSQISDLKKNIELLNKKNSRILEINSKIIKIRDICSQASGAEYAEEKLIKFKLNAISEHTSKELTELSLSFQDLFTIFNQANVKFKENETLRDYQDSVVNINHEISAKNILLKNLTSYSKISKEIYAIEKKRKGIHSNIDSYLDIEKQIENLSLKKDQTLHMISNLDKDKHQLLSKQDEIQDILEKLKSHPTIHGILSDLKKFEIKLTDPTLDKCNNETKSISKKITKEKKKLTIDQADLESINLKIKDIREKISNINENVEKSAKSFGYKDVGLFLTYVAGLKKKIQDYSKKTNELEKRLSNLQEDLKRVINGSKPRNAKNYELITTEFDKNFKEIYGKKEFFDFVFKEYKQIKRFDISKKTIIFETPEGFEEQRDLDDFSSGEKTYAYCRAIISIAANVAQFNIVILDESYALLDHEHSFNLYQFQRDKIEEGGITKFINILPLKDDLEAIDKTMQRSLEDAKSEENKEKMEVLNSNFKVVHDFFTQVKNAGYYQEIHYPFEKTLNLALNRIDLTIGSKISKTTQDLSRKLTYSFVLDGSNISRNNTNSKYAKINDVLRCKEKLMSYGVPEENIIILFGAGIRHNLAKIDLHTFNQLIKQENVNQAPKGRDDDWFIISFARDNNGYIISNDYFKEYSKKYPEMQGFLKSRSIRYNIIRNQCFFEEGIEKKLKKIISTKS